MSLALIIDAGTTSVRAVLVNEAGNIVQMHQLEFQQYFPQPGWIEHDPEEIFDKVVLCAREVIKRSAVPESEIVGLGITNQRETIVVWDKTSGQPLGRAIVWQDRRTSQFCDALKAQQLETLIQQKTGLLLDPYFSATKIHWLLYEHQAREAAVRGELLFGTMDCYLLWRLTEGRNHATDITNASRTLLCDINTKQWDPELFQLFDIPIEMAPTILPSLADFGVTSKTILDVQVPIRAMIGDQQAALLGQGCIYPNDAKCTYGTGCFLMVNTGEQLRALPHVLATVAFSVQNQSSYAIEGSIFAAGSIMKWLRDGLGLIQTVTETAAIAASLKDNEGVYLVPAFTGLGAPYWDPEARGAIYGLTRDTRPAHFIRAGLEAIAYQTKDLLNVIQEGCSLSSLRVDGGVTANTWLMQFLADTLQITIEVSGEPEATSLGAAYLVLLSANVLDNFARIHELPKISARYEPNVSGEQALLWYQGWLAAVSRTRGKP